ncbi:hypothetical protein L873DRAFT_1940703 [Choiromyces venosus 120613-1]|uniref:DDE Tnp4 domain-containing protein n=1 Tax=Choiromyces venosus 120613-1 TaxID=1336337 RepID=A0A3N4J7D2_9PEZI|nr:hypothetical protein L873DRAFT_1940703 [Choiromyces venosus 120613-1]
MIFWDHNILISELLTKYCEVIRSNGEPSGCIWGFSDGTYKVICRPGSETTDQKYFYSGYKKVDTLQFQAIATPDGLIRHLARPYEGQISDW